MEVLSPELQQAAKATLAAVPVATSDQPSGPGARASPVLLPPAPVPAPVPTSTSTGQSRQLSSQSVLSSAQSGSTGTIPPCVPLANQPFVPSAQYWYSFPMEDETAPQGVLDWVLGSNITVPV